MAVLDGSNMEELSGRELSKKLSVVLTERVRPEMMNCRDVVSTGRYPYTGKFGVLSETTGYARQSTLPAAGYHRPG